MVLWDSVVHTDRKIDSNRSGIIIKDFKEGTCTMLDVIISIDKNTSLKCGHLKQRQFQW